VRTERINTGKNIKPGDLIVALASTGVHSNGLTLARRTLLGDTPLEQKSNINKYAPDLGCTLGEELLKPTRIYVREIMEMLDTGVDLKAMTHITSGGFSNLNRVENNNIRFVIDALPPALPVFDLIQKQGGISDVEMFEVFNMGAGFCVVVKSADAVTAICKKYGISSLIIGHVEACQGKEVLIPEKNLVAREQTFYPL